MKKIRKGFRILKNIRYTTQMLSDFRKGEYRKVSKTTFGVLIFALLYTVIPVDFIPDIPPIGLIDDATVWAIVLNSLTAEIDRYLQWKKEKKVIEVEGKEIL